MTKNSRVLYLGDGPAKDNARYILTILKFLRLRVTHVPPAKRLQSSHLEGKISLVIISDYASKNISPNFRQAIEQKVAFGTSLLMIGGWASFHGFDGHYQGTRIDKILPVSCLRQDDRRNVPQGAVMIPSGKPHDIIARLSFKRSPVIVGYNRVRVKKAGRVILKLKEHGTGQAAPLLVVGHYGIGKTAALTTDIAPHWCGGLVDWGSKRVALKLSRRIGIEAGDLYVRFLSQLILWMQSH